MELNRRAAVVALLSLPLGYYRALQARGGWLTVDLSQWTGMTVKLGSRVEHITAKDIMDALQEDK